MYSLPIILANQNKNKGKEVFQNLSINNNNSTNIISTEFNATLIDDGKKSINSYSLLINGTEKIKKIFISNLFPLPAEFLAGYLTSHEKFGQKMVISLGFFFMSLCAISIVIFPDWLYLLSGGISFFATFSMNITKLYTSLAYDTYDRDYAYGLGNFFARITIIFIPFLSDFFLKINIYATCYVVLISSVIGCIVSLMIDENLIKKPIK